MDKLPLHRRIGAFCRDRRGLAGADFALVTALVFGGRHLALCHGTELGALFRVVLPA